MKKIENNFAVTGFVAKDAEVRQFTYGAQYKMWHGQNVGRST